MPGVAQRRGQSLKSRCAWALTSPGRMATLPRSQTSPFATLPAHGDDPLPSIATDAVGNRTHRPPERRSEPSRRGGGCADHTMGHEIAATARRRGRISDRPANPQAVTTSPGGIGVPSLFAALDGLLQLFFPRFRTIQPAEPHQHQHGSTPIPTTTAGHRTDTRRPRAE